MTSILSTLKLFLGNAKRLVAALLRGRYNYVKREIINSVRQPKLYNDYACDYPLVYAIEPGNICNLRCPFCFNGQEGGEYFPDKGYLSLNNYEIILEKIAPYAEVVALYNWGESYLNKNINEMVRMAADRGIYTVIYSNLSLPHMDHEAIVKSGLSLLVASIDGACQETYSKYRIGGDYGLVLRNIALIQAAKKRLKSRTPEIRWQFLVNKFNEHELTCAKKAADELGISISYKKMLVADGSWETSLSGHEYLWDYLATASREKYQFANKSLPITIEKILLNPAVPELCRQVFNQITIDWDGTVYPCCGVYDKRAVLGNLLVDSLKTVWNSQKYRECREYIFNYGSKLKMGAVCAKTSCLLQEK